MPTEKGPDCLICSQPTVVVHGVWICRYHEAAKDDHQVMLALMNMFLPEQCDAVIRHAEAGR